MKISEQWSHLGGREIINARFSDALDRVSEAVKASSCVASTDPQSLDSALRTRLAACALESSDQPPGTVRVATSGRRKPGPYPIIEQQRDFIPVTVNMRMTPFGFCDVVDLESLYRANEADAGVLIIPSSRLAQRLYPEWPEAASLLGDRQEFARRLPTVPLLVLALDA